MHFDRRHRKYCGTLLAFITLAKLTRSISYEFQLINRFSANFDGEPELVTKIWLQKGCGVQYGPQRLGKSLQKGYHKMFRSEIDSELLHNYPPKKCSKSEDFRKFWEKINKSLGLAQYYSLTTFSDSPKIIWNFCKFMTRSDSQNKEKLGGHKVFPSQNDHKLTEFFKSFASPLNFACLQSIKCQCVA